MPNENLIKLHSNLSKKWEGFSVPLEQFEIDMQDDTKRAKLHKNLTDKWDGFNVSFEQFSVDMGVKKKEPPQSSQPATTGIASSAGAKAKPVAPPRQPSATEAAEVSKIKNTVLKEYENTLNEEINVKHITERLAMDNRFGVDKLMFFNDRTKTYGWSEEDISSANQSMKSNTKTTDKGATVVYKYNGQYYVAPKVRKVNGVTVSYSDEEAKSLAIKNNDGIPANNEQEAANISKDYSMYLSYMDSKKELVKKQQSEIKEPIKVKESILSNYANEIVQQKIAISETERNRLADENNALKAELEQGNLDDDKVKFISDRIEYNNYMANKLFNDALPEYGYYSKVAKDMEIKLKSMEKVGANLPNANPSDRLAYEELKSQMDMLSSKAALYEDIINPKPNVRPDGTNAFDEATWWTAVNIAEPMVNSFANTASGLDYMMKMALHPLLRPNDADITFDYMKTPTLFSLTSDALKSTTTGYSPDEGFIPEVTSNLASITADMMIAYAIGNAKATEPLFIGALPVAETAAKSRLINTFTSVSPHLKSNFGLVMGVHNFADVVNKSMSDASPYSTVKVDLGELSLKTIEGYLSGVAYDKLGVIGANSGKLISDGVGRLFLNTPVKNTMQAITGKVGGFGVEFGTMEVMAGALKGLETGDASIDEEHLPVSLGTLMALKLFGAVTHPKEFKANMFLSAIKSGVTQDVRFNSFAKDLKGITPYEAGMLEATARMKSEELKNDGNSTDAAIMEKTADFYKAVRDAKVLNELSKDEAASKLLLDNVKANDEALNNIFKFNMGIPVLDKMGRPVNVDNRGSLLFNKIKEDYGLQDKKGSEEVTPEPIETKPVEEVKKLTPSDEVGKYFDEGTILDSTEHNTFLDTNAFETEQKRASLAKKVNDEIDRINKSTMSQPAKDSLLSELKTLKESIKKATIGEPTNAPDDFIKENDPKNNPIRKYKGWMVRMGDAYGKLQQRNDGVYYIKDIDTGNNIIVEGGESGKTARELGIEIPKDSFRNEYMQENGDVKLFQRQSVRDRLQAALNEAAPQVKVDAKVEAEPENLTTDASSPRQALENELLSMVKDGKIKATNKQVKSSMMIYDSIADTWTKVTGKSYDEFWEKFGVKIGNTDNTIDGIVLNQSISNKVKKAALATMIFTTIANNAPLIINKTVHYKNDKQTLEVLDLLSRGSEYIKFDENGNVSGSGNEPIHNDLKEYLLKLWANSGYPKIELNSNSKIRPHYNPVTNKMVLTAWKSLGVKENGASRISPSLVFAEMAHAMQSAEGKLKPTRVISDFIKTKSLDYSEQYKTEGTIEYEAHKIIEPPISDEFYKTAYPYLYQHNQETKGQKEKGQVKGSIQFTDTQAIVELFEKADVSTILHEFAGGHMGEVIMRDLAESDPVFKEHYDNVTKWVGKWDTAGKEKFARGWEKYIRTGKAPIKSLQEVFDVLSTALRNIYIKLKGSDIDINIPKEVKKAFDDLLGASTVDVVKPINVLKKQKLTDKGKLVASVRGGAEEVRGMENLQSLYSNKPRYTNHEGKEISLYKKETRGKREFTVYDIEGIDSEMKSLLDKREKMLQEDKDTDKIDNDIQMLSSFKPGIISQREADAIVDKYKALRADAVEKTRVAKEERASKLKPIKESIITGAKNMNWIQRTVASFSGKKAITKITNFRHYIKTIDGALYEQGKIDKAINDNIIVPAERKFQEINTKYHHKVQEALSDMLGNSYKAQVYKMTADIPDKTGVFYTDKDGNKQELIVSKDAAIKLWMHSQNIDGRATLMSPITEVNGVQRGNGFTEETIAQLEKYIGKKGMALGDKLMDMYTELFEMENKVASSPLVYGIPIRAVEGRYSGQLKRKGYMETISNEVNEYSNPNSAKVPGHHKRRVDSDLALDINDGALSSFESYLRDASNFIAFREAHSELNYVFKDRAVKDSMEKAFGRDFVMQAYNFHIPNLIGSYVSQSGGMDKLAKGFLGGVIPFSMSVAMMQAASTTMLMDKMSFKGSALFLPNMMDFMVRARMKDSVEGMIFEELRNDPWVVDRGLNTILGVEPVRLSAKEQAEFNAVTSKLRKGYRSALATRDFVNSKYGSWLVTNMDKFPIVYGGGVLIRDVYSSLSKEWNKTHSDKIPTTITKEVFDHEVYKQAKLEWYNFMEQNMQSQNRANQAEARIRSDWARAFNMLTSQPYQLMLRMADATGKMAIGLSKGDYQMVGKSLKTMAVVGLSQLVVQLIRDDFKKSDEAEFMFTMNYLASGVPNVSPILQTVGESLYKKEKGLYTEKEQFMIPFQAIEQMAESTHNLSKIIRDETADADDVQDALFDFVTEAGRLTGVNTFQLGRLYEGIVNMKDDNGVKLIRNVSGIDPEKRGTRISNLLIDKQESPLERETEEQYLKRMLILEENLQKNRRKFKTKEDRELYLQQLEGKKLSKADADRIDAQIDNFYETYSKKYKKERGYKYINELKKIDSKKDNVTKAVALALSSEEIRKEGSRFLSSDVNWLSRKAKIILDKGYSRKESVEILKYMEDNNTSSVPNEETIRTILQAL